MRYLFLLAICLFIFTACKKEMPPMDPDPLFLAWKQDSVIHAARQNLRIIRIDSTTRQN